MIFHLLMRAVCFEYSSVSLEYFLDEMEFYELYDIARYMIYSKKADYNIARMVLSPYCKDIMKKMPLPWDGDAGKEAPEITQEQHDAIRAMEEAIKNMQTQNK